MCFIKNNYIKSPLNYTGNKFNLLEQILPIFPKSINTFCDLFGGSLTVGININTDKIIYNEINPFVAELVEYISTCNIEEELKEINEIIIKYSLGKNTKEEYYYFRDEVYNKNPNPRMLFVLSCFSLNCQLRFNSKGKFNMTCGDKYFNDNMKERFIKFNKIAHMNNIEFFNKSFNEFREFNKNDFIYLDPPYLPTVTTYNEKRYCDGWNIEKEKQLYEYIDWLNSNNIKFALSNVSTYRDKENTILKEWSKKYIIHNLNYTYKNNKCYSKDNDAFTQEVLITNY